MIRKATAAALLSTVGLLIAPATAVAQTSNDVAPPSATDRPAATTNPAPAERFGLFDGGQLSVSTGTEDNNLTFRVGLPTGPSLSSRFSLAVSTPLQGDDQAQPATLDALANGTRVTLSWGYFDVPVHDPDEVATEIESRAQGACRAAHPDLLDCNNTAYAVWNYARRDWTRYQRHSAGPALDFGVDATVGFNDFEWLDPVTLLPQEARRTDWSVAAHLVGYLPGTHTALAGSASYQRAYEAADEELVCPAATTNPAADCRNARRNAPTLNENLLVSVGVRHRFSAPDGTLLNLAVAPLVTYDVIDNVWGVDVPVYVVPGEDGRLTGGIRFGYRTDRENEFSIGLFVGTTFDVFGGR